MVSRSLLYTLALATAVVATDPYGSTPGGGYEMPPNPESPGQATPPPPAGGDMPMPMPTEGQPPAGGEAPPAGGEEKVHVVSVGKDGLTFSPNNVIAAVGEIVQFQFYPKNHSVVQSTFDQPCVPIQNVMANKTDAFFSGFNPNPDPSKGLPVFSVRVTSDKPVWFYCSQGKHCQGGMVGAINAKTDGDKTVDAFKGLAAAAPENLSPGQTAGTPPPADGGASPSGTGSGDAPPAQTNAGEAPPAQPSPSTPPSAAGLSAIPSKFLGLTAAVVAGLWIL